MEIEIPVSVGELVDKVTILRIKQRMIPDQQKLHNVNKELEALVTKCQAAGINMDAPLVQDLEQINTRLWEIEDDIRQKERDQIFDEQFINLARAVYTTNDERFALKSELNRIYGSAMREEKSYEDY